MTREDVDRWLEAYVEAWKSYDRDKIAELFADDINYRFHPGDDPIVGRDAVVQSWLGEGDYPDASDRDEPGTYEAAYKAVAVEGDRAVATGITSYSDSPGGPVVRVYDNCFVMQFDSKGHCRQFTEWFVQRKTKSA
jgi:ketosteroid isomerase-like protein